jgi:hypothetical protein
LYAAVVNAYLPSCCSAQRKSNAHSAAQLYPAFNRERFAERLEKHDRETELKEASEQVLRITLLRLKVLFGEE